jgi:hypothetical protein
LPLKNREENALSDVDYATISTATTQQLDLDGMDVLGEFGDQLLAVSDRLAFDS